jgi:hypothetical protein
MKQTHRGPLRPPIKGDTSPCHQQANTGHGEANVGTPKQEPSTTLQTPQADAHAIGEKGCSVNVTAEELHTIGTDIR